MKGPGQQTKMNFFSCGKLEEPMRAVDEDPAGSADSQHLGRHQKQAEGAGCGWVG